jgi:hypothetical protein
VCVCVCVRDERVCECWQQRGYLGCCWLIGFHRRLMLQCVTSLSAPGPLSPLPLVMHVCPHWPRSAPSLCAAWVVLCLWVQHAPVSLQLVCRWRRVIEWRLRW